MICVRQQVRGGVQSADGQASGQSSQHRTGCVYM